MFAGLLHYNVIELQGFGRGLLVIFIQKIGDGVMVNGPALFGGLLFEGFGLFGVGDDFFGVLDREFEQIDLALLAGAFASAGRAHGFFGNVGFAVAHLDHEVGAVGLDPFLEIDL